MCSIRILSNDIHKAHDYFASILKIHPIPQLSTHIYFVALDTVIGTSGSHLTVELPRLTTSPFH